MREYILATVQRGVEFNACDIINDLGGLAVAPRQVELVRHPKAHKWIPKDSPVLDNYVFAAITAELEYEAKKFMRRAKITFRSSLRFDPRQWASVQAYAQRAEMDYQCRMAEIERQEAEHKPYLCPYQPGEALKLLDGAMVGQMVTFLRLTIKPGQHHPLIEWESQMMGQVVKGATSPLKLDKWAAE